MRILLVEDEPDGQELVFELLRFVNIDTDKVGSAEEALKVLSRFSDYDGIVIDLALPGMDGFGLLKALRENQQTAHLPCMAITAYHNSGVRYEALELGFDDYQPKPLDGDYFAEAVERLCTT